MKRLATIVAMFTAVYSYGQYNTAIGVRGGGTTGLTVKHFVSGNAALEGILGVWYHGVSGTILFEQHTPVFNEAGFNLYYGGGGHVAADARSRYYVYYYNDRRYSYYPGGGVGVGIDGIVGLEYKIPKAPIAFSLDVKPFVEFTNFGTWFSFDPGIGVKVAF